MMRKSGATEIKVLIPEKYKDFVQGVLENRHGKPSSKVTEVTETKPKISDSSSKRQQKRKYVESAISTKEEGPRRPPKRPREMKQGAWKSLNRVGDFNHYNLKKVKSDQHKRGNNGVKKHMKRTEMQQTNEGSIREHPIASKFYKQKQAGKKYQKIN